MGRGGEPGWDLERDGESSAGLSIWSRLGWFCITGVAPCSGSMGTRNFSGTYPLWPRRLVARIQPPGERVEVYTTSSACTVSLPVPLASYLNLTRIGTASTCARDGDFGITGEPDRSGECSTAAVDGVREGAAGGGLRCSIKAGEAGEARGEEREGRAISVEEADLRGAACSAEEMAAATVASVELVDACMEARLEEDERCLVMDLKGERK